MNFELTDVLVRVRRVTSRGLGVRVGGGGRCERDIVEVNQRLGLDRDRGYLYLQGYRVSYIVEEGPSQG